MNSIFSFTILIAYSWHRVNTLNNIWQNFYNYRDQFGFPVVRNLIERAQKGGGWVTYEWRGAIKVSLVKKVEKFGKPYVIGAGYYPFSKKDNVVSLVKGAVGLFNQCIEENRPISEAFAEFGYPKGRFVLGDLYIYALIMSGPRKGEHVAHGERPGLIGVNEWDYRDKDGKFVNHEIAEKLNGSTEGVWIEYESKGTQKKTYAEKVKDKSGTEYFIACGYYPDAAVKQSSDLVDKGYRYMKSHGISEAATDFDDSIILITALAICIFLYLTQREMPCRRSKSAICQKQPVR